MGLEHGMRRTWERRRSAGQHLFENGSVLGEVLPETLIKGERKKTVFISKEPAKLRHKLRSLFLISFRLQNLEKQRSRKLFEVSFPLSSLLLTLTTTHQPSIFLPAVPCASIHLPRHDSFTIPI